MVCHVVYIFNKQNLTRVQTCNIGIGINTYPEQCSIHMAFYYTNASYLMINLKNNFHRLHFNDLLRHYIDIVSGPWEPFYTFPVESCLCLCLFCCYINTIFMCNILYFLQAKVIYCFIYIVRESSKGLVNRFMKLKKNKYETLFQKLYASAVGHSNKTETFTTAANLLKSEISQVFDVCLISV